MARLRGNSLVLPATPCACTAVAPDCNGGPAEGLPALRLDHLLRLTDDTSIVQHSIGSVPDPRTGYTVDDTARALIVAVRLAEDRGSKIADRGPASAIGDPRSSILDPPSLVARYLAFLAYAQKENGTFHNCFDYRREPLDAVGSQDCQGQAVWGLAVAAGAARDEGHRFAALQLLACCLPTIGELSSPRALAFALLGLCSLRAVADDFADMPRTDVLGLAAELAERLASRFAESTVDDWRWFEAYLTYANARLPEAMLRAGVALGNKRWREVGVESLEFLSGLTMRGDFLEVIGNDGWMRRGESKPAAFDQQCVDAGAMVEAFVAAFDVTGDPRHLARARRCLDWFHGRNVQQVKVYDENTGACYDGLTPTGVNRNQGAESTLAYLMARLALRTPSERGRHA